MSDKKDQESREKEALVGDASSFKFASQESDDEAWPPNIGEAQEPELNQSFSLVKSPAEPKTKDAGSGAVDDGVKVMADGPWQFRISRMRRRYLGANEKDKRGYGEITREETVWLILVSLAFANNRSELETNHDVVAYIQLFFLLWTVLYSCIFYSSRFNDRDFFHMAFWNCILLGLLFFAGSIGEGPHTMGWSGCALHLLLAGANARAAVYIPRARLYCFGMMFMCLANASVMACLALVDCTSESYQVLLWINVFLQPFLYTLYRGVLWVLDCVYPPEDETGLGFGESLNVPADFTYIFNRWQGLHVLAVVGAFISSIAIDGAQALTVSTPARIIAVCAFIFALLLKLSILDVDLVSHKGDDSLRHPYRQKYFRQAIFLLLWPYSVLCVALTGIGFLLMLLDSAKLAPSVPGDHIEDFSRKLTSISAACTWIILATNKAMTIPRIPIIHWPKVVIIYILSISFWGPVVFQLGHIWSAVWLAAVQALILLSELMAMFCDERERRSKIATWRWSRLTFQKKHEMDHKHLLEAFKTLRESEPSKLLRRQPSELDNWKVKRKGLLQDWEHRNQTIGPKIDPHELFSTTLLGVSLSTMTGLIQDTNTIQPDMVFYFVTMYGAFSIVNRFSSRFSTRELSNRIAFSVFQFLMVLQIVGMQADIDNMFAAVSAIQYVWVALAFWFPIARDNPQHSRTYALYCCVVCCVLAAICSFKCFFAGHTHVKLVLVGIFVVSMFSEPMFNISTWYLMNEDERHKKLLPVNPEYVHNRFYGGFASVTATCILKNDATEFWGTMHHPGLAIVCVFCIALMAISVISANFHTDLVSRSRHAILRGEIYEALYLFLYPLILISVALIGGMMLLLLTAVGEYGLQSRSTLAKDGLCISTAAFFFLLAATKYLHMPGREGVASESCKALRAAIQLINACLSLSPLLIGSMHDLSTTVYISLLAFFCRYLQLLLNMIADASPHKSKPKSIQK